jgi:protein-S-isoprenylcysteine O-methyltransferase Ste14
MSMKVKFFDLVPEFKLPILYFVLVLIILTAIVLALSPLIFGFGLPYIFATSIFCVLTFLLWIKGYGLAKKKDDIKKNYRFALFFFFLPSMSLWYAALIMPFLSQGLEIDLGLNFLAFIVVAAISFLMWLRAIRTFSTDELFAVGSFFKTASGLRKTSSFAYVRHPFLSVALFVSFSFFLLAPGFYSSVCFVIVFLTAYFWTQREELELIHRFGNEYSNYRNITGRFVPKPSKIIDFMHLLFRGSS